MSLSQLHSDAPLTREELTSIAALVEYLEFKRGGQNASRHLAAEYEVTEVKEIKRRDYDRAVAFLVDLQDIRIY